jgi:hypothetical protein
LHDQRPPPLEHQSRDRRPLILTQNSTLAGKRSQMLFSTSPKLRQTTRTAHLPCLTVAADTSVNMFPGAGGYPGRALDGATGGAAR